MNRRVSVETIGHAPCRAWPRGDTRTDGWSAAPNRRAELRRSAGVTAGRQFLPLVLTASAGTGTFSNILSRAGGANRKTRCPRYSRAEGSWRDAKGGPYKKLRTPRRTCCFAGERRFRASLAKTAVLSFSKPPHTPRANNARASSTHAVLNNLLLENRFVLLPHTRAHLSRSNN